MYFPEVGLRQFHMDSIFKLSEVNNIQPQSTGHKHQFSGRPGGYGLNIIYDLSELKTQIRFRAF